jgi:hypothetical protein
MSNEPNPSPSAIANVRVAELLKRRQTTRAIRAAALEKLDGRFTLKLQLSAAAEEVASASTQTAGYLVAAGDSWFDYPFPFCDDILVQLHDHHGYNIESSAHYGDRIESMPYKGGQIDRLLRNLDKLHDQGITPKAVLISGGGNDFAGEEFGMLLNSAASGIGGWNQEILDGLIQQRIRTSYYAFLLDINQLCSTIFGQTIPILIHGYDYPVPDGRGFLGGAWILPGPWLKPGFDEKLFINDVPGNTNRMRTVIDKFNDMLTALVQDPSVEKVHYIDLRNTLSSVLTDDAYKQDWNNELHPEERGFVAIANKFARVLDTL